MPKKKVIYYQKNDITVLNDDILKTSVIEAGSVDLVVTSPPYNVDIQYNSHRDDVSYVEYLEFSEKWLTQCFNFLRDDGRLCLKADNKAWVRISQRLPRRSVTSITPRSFGTKATFPAELPGDHG
jgi:DNA modification methylase